jgi:nucleoside-diphosphate-sugar epimerase
VISGPVLVTGATGLIGSQLVRRLRGRNLEVHGVSRSAEPSSLSHRADLSEQSEACEVVQNISPSMVFHLAGSQHATTTSRLYADNVLATVNVMHAAARLNPMPAIVAMGSASEYGDPDGGPVTEESPTHPLTEYGRSKVAASTLARTVAERAHLRLCIVRPFNVVSPHLPPTTALGNMRRQLLEQSGESRVVRCGRVDVVRDFVPLDFIIDVLVRMLDLDSWPGTLNVCTGVGVELGELLVAMGRVIGAEVEVVPVQDLVEIAAAPRIVGDPALLRRLSFECTPTPTDLAALMMGPGN